MKPAIRLLLLSLLSGVLGTLAPFAARASEATFNDVYAQAVRIEQEIRSLKRHLKVSGEAKPEIRNGDLTAHHVQAMAYILQLKLGKLRRELGLNYIEPVSIEPALEMSPTRPWSMTQRILTEIQIIRFYLGVPGQPPATVAVKDKRAVDAFNKLNQASAETELLAGAVTPNEVYSQAKRLHEDVNAVLRQQGIFEHAVPPPRRENFQPKDSLRAVFDVMSEIQRLQRARGMSTTDFKGFDSTNKTVPDDVFDAVGLTLAELQRLKARLGMVHQLTPPATYEKNKTPSDVVQLLGYTSAKLREIK